MGFAIRKSADLGTKGIRTIANDAVLPSTVAVTSAAAGTGISVSASTGAVTITNSGVTSIAGTSNQITVSASTGSVTLSIPSSPTLAGTLTAGSFYAVGQLTLNRSSATGTYAGGNINLQVDGVTQGQIGVSGSIIQTSVGVTVGGTVSVTGTYNGPLTNNGAVLRMRSGNEGSWLWDGTFRLYVDNTNVKNFTIQHPTKPDNYLVHACAEGPTSDVFYRGEGRLQNGRCVIDLPNYFEELTEIEGRSIMLTPIADENGMVANLAAYEIYDGHFVVEQIGGYNVPDQRFWWRVDAIRKNTSFPVEPLKESVEVGGFGPYTFIKETA